MDDEDGGDALGELAALLGVAPERLLAVTGGGWVPAEVPAAHPPGARWFASGVPVQVLLGLAGRTLAVARPVPRWHGAAGLVTEALDVEELAVDDVELTPEVVTAAVDRAVRRRRGSFRWCPLCRELTPPEWSHDRHSCSDCAVRYRGVG